MNDLFFTWLFSVKDVIDHYVSIKLRTDLNYLCTLSQSLG